MIDNQTPTILDIYCLTTIKKSDVMNLAGTTTPPGEREPLSQNTDIGINL